jgi:hypothetical protein
MRAFASLGQSSVKGVLVEFLFHSSFQVGRWILEIVKKNDIGFLFKIDLKIKLKITNHTLRAHDIENAEDVSPVFFY